MDMSCIFTDRNFDQELHNFNSKKNKFWFIEIDIIEYLLNSKPNYIKRFFLENLDKFHEKTVLFEYRVMSSYLNHIFKYSESINFRDFFRQYKIEFVENTDIKMNFFSDFPELFRLLYVFYKNQIDAIDRIFHTIRRNSVEIRKCFNIEVDEIERIKVGIGDAHQDGAATTEIIVGGKSIFLKYGDNHTSNVISLYNKFLKKFGLPTVEFRSLNIEECYLEERILRTPISDIKTVMKTSGVLLFISYLLGITDLHYENLIINSNIVIPIDCETVYANSDLKFYTEFNLLNSVYSSFILPCKKFEGSFLSGLCSEIFVKYSVKDISLDISDAGILINEKNKNKVNRNGSSLQGYKMNNYLDEIRSYFSKAYRYYLDNKDNVTLQIIKRFVGKKKRVLLKNTFEYTDALSESFFSYLLTSSDARYDHFKRAGVFKQEEIDFLFNNNIPLIYTDITFPEKYLQRFNEEDLRLQILLITKSVSFGESNVVEKSQLKSSVNQVSKFYNFLLSELIYSTDYNEYFYLDICEYGIGNRNYSEIIKTPVTIYSGMAGICLFMLEYQFQRGNINENILLCNLIESVFVEFEKLVSDKYSSCGIYDGTAGLFYLFYKYNKYYGEVHFENLWHYLEKIIENSNNDTKLDIISGSAGLLKLLVYLWKDGNKIHQIELGIKELQVRLLNHIGDLMEWIDSHEYLGYSHGIAGMIAALSESLSIVENDSIKVLVDTYVMFLRESFEDNDYSFYKLNGVTISDNWCHGKAGILLALLSISKLEGGLSVDRLMYNMAYSLLKNNNENNMKICHGQVGNYLIVYQVAKYLNDKDLEKVTLGYLEKEIITLDVQMFDTYQKNFMVGLSGIYYWSLLKWDIAESLDLL